MNNELIEKAKGLSREERMKLFADSKKELASDDLENVNGGGMIKSEPGNPHSSGFDDKGNYFTSMGYVCGGVVNC